MASRNLRSFSNTRNTSFFLSTDEHYHMFARCEIPAVRSPQLSLTTDTGADFKVSSPSNDDKKRKRVRIACTHYLKDDFLASFLNCKPFLTLARFVFSSQARIASAPTPFVMMVDRVKDVHDLDCRIVATLSTYKTPRSESTIVLIWQPLFF
jgi:hypothetical protein